MTLAISEDGETWIDLGDISGGRAEVDLAGLPLKTGGRKIAGWRSSENETCVANVHGSPMVPRGVAAMVSRQQRHVFIRSEEL